MTLFPCSIVRGSTLGAEGGFKSSGLETAGVGWGVTDATGFSRCAVLAPLSQEEVPHPHVNMQSHIYINLFLLSRGFLSDILAGSGNFAVSFIVSTTQTIKTDGAYSLAS
jgi:integral membrane sensor domain MASE1